MSVLRFASEEALRFGITSGLVPEAVVAGPAATWRDAGGGILVRPGTALGPEPMKALAAAGVQRLPEASGKEEGHVSCWAEIFPVASGRPIEEVGQVLFVVPDDASLVDLAGELLRLGCDRLEWRSAPCGHLIRAFAPPYYSLLRATEGGGAPASSPGKPMAFVPTPKGQDRVWTEIGHAHPLAHLLAPADGQILLVSTEGFASLPDAPFTDGYALVDLRVPGATPAPYAPRKAPRLAITMRLARAASAGPASLWILRDEAAQKVERMLSAMPEDIGHGLLFCAASEGDRPVVILRARPGSKVTIEIDGEPYRAHGSIGNLFLPDGTTLEPPLRLDRVQELLVPDPDDVVWLRRHADEDAAPGSFTAERIREGAFRPLLDWVDYVIDTHAAELVPWVKSATFDFEAFVGVDAPVAAVQPGAEPAVVPVPKRRRRNADPEPRALAPAPASRLAVESAMLSSSIEAATFIPEVSARALAAVEQAFLKLDPTAETSTRSALWAQMAPLNADLGHDHDAALCWARVVWEGQTDAMDPWLRAERKRVRGASLPTLLAVEGPDRQHVRAVAVSLIAGDAPDDLLQPASLWLDNNDDALDPRTAWLARVALSKRVGGDRLGLARARDRLLAKIHRGLSLERDVPAFLRRAGAERDASQIELLGGKLDALLETFEKTRRKRSATEADPKLTGAYARFVVAYGAARIGRASRASALRDQALKTLPRDAIHDVLSRAFVARIGQALEGLPAETPMPSEISATLATLTKLDRYKVDRVRQSSKVLEPQERLDPISAFQRGETDPRGPEFAELRGASDPRAIERTLAAILAKARTSAPEERARIYDGAMDFFPMIAHERAVTFLEALLCELEDIPPTRKVAVLEEALMLAGHLGEERLARTIFAVLDPIISKIGPDGAVEVAPLASGMLRTLRRFGLREEAARLLRALQSAAKGKATSHLIARLHTAAAQAYLGELEGARPVFDEALTVLSGELSMPERLQLTRALTRALGATPLTYAVAGLDQVLKRLDAVTDSYNTNTHVCLSVLDFVEALALGYASDELAIDPASRRFIDEDEYLVRRRIHRDLMAS